LDAFSVIDRIAVKVAPGRPPTYTAAHVLKALEVIGSGSGVGRQQLSRELGLGEGMARTLVRRLRGEGLVEVHRSGMVLLPSGVKLLSGFRARMASTEAPETGVTVGSRNYAVLVKGAAGCIRRGVEQRDAALIAGAKGATTLLYDGVRFHMPGMYGELDPHLTCFLIDRLKPEAGDIVIIGTADDLPAAEMGAKTAALELLREIAGSAA